MTGRDRLVITIVAVVAIIGAAYLMVVSPERKKASSVASEVDTASSRLASAESKLAEARQAQARYAAAYASIVTLGKAVPTSEEVPSLIYQLAQATHQKKVEFSSIVSKSSWDWIGFERYPSMPPSRQRSRSAFIACAVRA